MSTEQKVAQLTDEFETVKQLLASAASFAESSSRKVDRLSDKIDRVVEAQAKTDERLTSFIFEVNRLMVNLADRVSPLEGNLERLEGIVRFLVQKESQAAAQRQRDEDERKAERERLDRKFDELISQMAEDRKQAAIDRAESQRRWEANQAEIQRIWQYLMQQQQQDG